ncbi:unnamed protein product [Acanthoscelides obtectus]|uniref:Uncharacterized protein n=1 Tax=Acanthoscelides obtectus TaxID=200917 RepID=A0A9P0PPP1_ACAOB|nr:unnamed protein product [Acanthoscelides obtectus]CAK1634069.1 hypothetical protein AOBTE_LOCUS8580 [Acanthoscelides obtectus]
MHSKLLAIAPDVNTRFTLPSGRRNQIIMSRLRIGHTLVTHKHIFEGTDAPVCSTCNQRLTVVHILTYQNARSLNHLSNDISEVLLHQTDKLVKFIKDIDIEAIPLPTWKKIDSPGELADEEMMIDIQNIAKVAAASKGVRIPYFICFTDSKVIKEVQWKGYKLTAIQILMMIQKTNTSIMRKKEDWSVINRLMKYDFDKR